jgi:hypothetical protein
VVTVRVGLAAVVLLLVAWIGATRVLARLPWSAFLVMGVLNNAIPFLLIVWAQTQIASGLAAILNATTPLFTVVVAHLFTTDERLTSGRILGVMLGLAGVIVIVGPDMLHSLGADVAAQLACLGAALSYAFAAVFGRRFAAMRVSPIQTAVGQTAGRQPAARSGDVRYRPTLDASDAEQRNDRRANRNCGSIHRACLYSLLSDSRKRRGNEPSYRHLSDPDQRHRPWVCLSSGNAAASASGGTGVHWLRSGGDRWARLAGAFGYAREHWLSPVR